MEDIGLVIKTVILFLLADVILRDGDKEVKRIPTEADLEIKPASVTKADMLKGMYVVKNLNLDEEKDLGSVQGLP